MGFWRRVHNRALPKALTTLFESRKRIVIAFIVWLVVMSLVWTLDRSDFWNEVTLSLIATLAPILVFPGLYLWEFIHSIPLLAEETKPAPMHRDWMGLREGITVFCDPEYVAMRDSYWDTYRSNLERAQALEIEMRSLSDAVPGGGFKDRPEDLKRYNALRNMMERHSRLASIAESGLSETWHALLKDLKERLLSGELVAQGFSEPHSGGQSEVQIKASKWRILKVIVEDGAAVTIRAPSVVVYSGIQIASTEALKRKKSGPQIDIRFDKRAPYEVSDIKAGRVISTIRIGILNSGDQPLSNCIVEIENISPLPPLVGGLPIRLQVEPFILRPDHPEKLIDVAMQWDHVGNRLRFNAPHGFGAETLNYIDSSVVRTIVIKVAATESQRSATFRLSSDESKKLRLEFIGYVA